MDITLFVDPRISELFLAKNSSFDLGVAITAISIFTGFFSFAYSAKFNLRIKLRIKFIVAIGVLLFLSIVLTFLGEMNLIVSPFFLQICGALLMFTAICLAVYVIIFPIKVITQSNIKNLRHALDDFLVHKNNSDLLEHLGDVTFFYRTLLELSLKNKDAEKIFLTIFTSKHFLKLFSEHGYLFEETIRFYIKNTELSMNKNHILSLIRKIFGASLSNKNSFLNSFIDEEIYPDALSYIDCLFLNNTKINYQNFFFEDIGFSFGIEGKIAYMRMVKRYFKLVYQKNTHYSLPGGYEKKLQYNDQLIESFLRNIRNFFESEYDISSFKKLFSELESFGWYYRWGNSTSDKSENLRKKMGEFIYDVLHEVSRIKTDEDDGLLRLKLLNLFNNYIETQDNSREANLALKAFIEKIKEKITKEGFGSNSEGYYPALIKIYFLIFGFDLFSGGSGSDLELKELHIPVMRKIKESFPKLHDGFKHEFYNLTILPEEKMEKLQKEGREIINNFISSNMVYDPEENSLSYYYSGGNHGSKINLNQFHGDSIKIITQEI